MDDGYENLIENDEEYLSEPHWWSPGVLLTSAASAITAFTLTVAGMMGFVGYPVAEALVGPPEGPDDMRERAIVNGIVVLLLLMVAVWLSQRVILDEGEEAPAWGRHLAGSSVVIAAIGSALSIVTIAASLVSPI